MDSSSSVNAGLAWDRVLKSDNVITVLWLAAVESALSIHALQPNYKGKVYTPEAGKTPLQDWFDEVEHLLRNALRHNYQFGYHLTLLYSMYGDHQNANVAWADYVRL